jgi:hypothetical protein
VELRVRRQPDGSRAHSCGPRGRDRSDEFAPDFVRIHRNALVAERHVAAVERNADGQYSVRMRGYAEPLQVSRRHAGELLRRLRDGVPRPAGSEADEA